MSKDPRHIAENHVAALRGLQGDLLSAAHGDAPRSILVTSCKPGEGKTTSAISLALSLSRNTDQKVLLVDANFRAPTLADTYHIQPSAGFWELLSEGLDPADLRQETDVESLGVLAAGSPEPRAASLKNFPSALEAMQKAHDVIVLDGDALWSSSEPLLLAPMVDAVILVAACERSRWEVLDQARDKISRVGGRLLGVTLNRRKYYIPGGLYDRL